jgi:hypothetical protein
MHNAVVLGTVPEWAGLEACPENRLGAYGNKFGKPGISDSRGKHPAGRSPYRWNRKSPAAGGTISELESSMNQVQVDQKSYQMPPVDGFTIAHFLTVADVERSLRFYETVFGGRILSRGDSSGAPGYIQIANTWLLVNPGGGPTPDKPTVTLSVPADPDKVSNFMNIRVAGWAKEAGIHLRPNGKTQSATIRYEEPIG